MNDAAAFDLNNDDAFKRWRDAKLTDYPQTLGDLVVEINDPFNLTEAEKAGLLSRCAKANMVVYIIKNPESIPENPLPALLKQIGVQDLDLNLGAGPGGLSALSPGGSAHAPFAEYIPYRAAAIGWHTDGYYNANDRQVRTLSLYCERPAHEGGENDVLDHEIAYLQLREQNPDIIRALMDPEAMTIPARLENGQVARPERPGPVFSIDHRDGFLHMRYTARTISIRWQDDAATREAVAALENLMSSPSPYHFTGRLETGWGLISTNVLHTRRAFHDLEGGHKRILYRARLFDRVPQPA